MAPSPRVRLMLGERRVGTNMPFPLYYCRVPLSPYTAAKDKKRNQGTPFLREDEQAYLKRRCPW